MATGSNKWLPVAALLILSFAWSSHAADYADDQGTNGTAYIAQPATPPGTSTLLEALHKDEINHIIMQSNYTVTEAEFPAPVVLTRNITISSADPSYVLDLANLTGIIELCSTCTFKFLNITTTNEVAQGSRSIVISILRGQGPGSRVVTINYQTVRLVCIPTSSSIANIKTMTRSPWFFDPPGALQQVEAVTATFGGYLFENMLHVIDMTYDVPLDLVQGLKYTGGYAVHRINSTRLCIHIVGAECLTVKSPDVCIAELTKQLMEPSPSPGPQPSKTGTTVAVAVAVPIAGAALLAALAALLFAARRRHQLCWRAAAPKQPPAGPAAAAATAAVDMEELPDIMPGSESDQDNEGCVRTVQQPLSFGSLPWKVAGSHTVLRMKHASNSRIELGELLGAGSFARVFKGRWADMDVAVKVIEHDSDAAAAVANEVQLNMSLVHPNIVQAYHYTTFVRRSPADAVRPRSSSAGAACAGHILQISTSPRNFSAEPHSSTEAAAGQLQSPLPMNVNRQASVQVPATPVGQTPAGARPSMDSGACSSSLLSQCALPDQEPEASDAPITPGASVLQHHVICSTTASIQAWPCMQQPPSAADAQPARFALSSSAPLMATGHQSAAAARCETWLVQELCNGTLADVVAKWKDQEEGDAKMLRRLLLLRDCAQGLELMHSKCIVHGDLNASNVLVSNISPNSIHRTSCSLVDGSMLVAKLGDLGLSRVVKTATHRTTRTVGTMSHMPPCLLQYGRFSPPLDVYSFGIMMWELYTGKVAFQQLHYGQFFETVVLRNLRPQLPPDMPDDYQLLMERCWATEPNDRPTVKLVLECLELMIDDRRSSLQQAAAGTRAVCRPPAEH